MSVVLAPTEYLKCVRKERHAKCRRGAEVAFVVVDRERQWALLGQKLQLMSKWINANIVDGKSWNRVSTTGLWGSVGRVDGREWHKGRFKVRAVDLGRAIEEFERTRAAYSNSAVVASELGAYAIAASDQGGQWVCGVSPQSSVQ